MSISVSCGGRKNARPFLEKSMFGRKCQSCHQQSATGVRPPRAPLGTRRQRSAAPVAPAALQRQRGDPLSALPIGTKRERAAAATRRASCRKETLKKGAETQDGTPPGGPPLLDASYARVLGWRGRSRGGCQRQFEKWQL